MRFNTMALLAMMTLVLLGQRCRNESTMGVLWLPFNEVEPPSAIILQVEIVDEVGTRWVDVAGEFHEGDCLLGEAVLLRNFRSCYVVDDGSGVMVNLCSDRTHV